MKKILPKTWQNLIQHISSLFVVGCEKMFMEYYKHGKVSHTITKQKWGFAIEDYVDGSGRRRCFPYQRERYMQA
jgi:hypothetical protein